MLLQGQYIYLLVGPCLYCFSWPRVENSDSKETKDLLNDRIPLTHYLCFFMIIMFLEF